MSQYCDSKILERNWFHWLLSSTTPSLEDFRKSGVLWTKVIDNAKKGSLPNPRNPVRRHCIALATPIYFNSNGDTIDSKGVVNGTKEVLIEDVRKELSLLSDSELHMLNTPFIQADIVIPGLIKDEYILELPTDQTWHAVLSDINKMCHGIVMNFNQPNEEEQSELASEALLQVAKKLADLKLVYTPGKAPVFNLLTTTIFRCMYSIMNRRKNQRKGLQKYMNEIQSGLIQWHRQAGLPGRPVLQTTLDY